MEKNSTEGSKEEKKSSVSEQSVLKAKPKSNTGVIVAVVIAIVIVVLLCGACGLVFFFASLGNDRAQEVYEQTLEEASSDVDSVADEPTVIFPTEVNPQYSDLWEEPNRVNTDYVFESGGLLPYSKKFLNETMTQDRSLGISDGFPTAFVTMGGYPTLFNISVPMPMDWDLDTIETTQFIVGSFNDAHSSFGVILFPLDPTEESANYSCEDVPESIYTDQTVEAGSATDVNSYGVSYERVYFDIYYDDGHIVEAIVQCRQTETELMTVVLTVGPDDYAKYGQYMDDMMDEFWLKEV